MGEDKNEIKISSF